MEHFTTYNNHTWWVGSKHLEMFCHLQFLYPTLYSCVITQQMLTAVFSINNATALAKYSNNHAIRLVFAGALLHVHIGDPIPHLS
ncbi:hypothetical protein XELAEV_18041140mg [Xenopus laevis]|uniref:Uncharacterized protein n=1 Tax=Xenopus laevis TaxID=8355 RepID=A0A974C1W5_XENLA|nr:hypothetical protein XELAEV_18041140mg [Xenopus laevis]